MNKMITDIEYQLKKITSTLACLIIILISTSFGLAQSAYVTPPVWSPKGNHVASVINHSVEIIDAFTNQIDYVLSGHTDLITMVAWSPNGSNLASASV